MERWRTVFAFGNRGPMCGLASGHLRDGWQVEDCQSLTCGALKQTMTRCSLLQPSLAEQIVVNPYSLLKSILKDDKQGSGEEQLTGRIASSSTAIRRDSLS